MAQRNFPERPLVDQSIPAILFPGTGIRPKWLRTEYRANEWRVTDIGANPDVFIKFDVSLPNGRDLADYPGLLESIKRVVFGVRQGPLCVVASGKTQAQIAQNLIVLARWAIDRGLDSFDQLTKSDFSEYVEVAQYGVNALLNSESILNSHIEKLVNSACFCEDDTPAVRRSKAASVFPTVGRSTQPSLCRTKMLFDAGLEGVGFNGSAIPKLFDELELVCCMYQTPAKLLRMAVGPEPEELNDQVVTTEHLRRMLMAFEYLYEHRRYLERSIRFNPSKPQSMLRIAQSLGRTVGRTRSIPVLQAITLIERSVRWVLDYSGTILKLKAIADAALDGGQEAPERAVGRALRDQDWENKGPGNPFPILPGEWKRGGYAPEVTQGSAASGRGMTLPAAITYLLTACAVVITAFTARRSAEVTGLKYGCIERDNAGQPWLRCFIHKTLQAETLIPIPEIVVLAISVLETLSERARSETETVYLFQYNLPGTCNCIGVSAGEHPTFGFAEYIRKFGYFLDIPLLPDGTRWTFLPHQLRRFFAILYIWIYDLGDLPTLSYHLRHTSLEKTRRYVQDAELGHILSHVDREHTVSILTGAVLGKSEIGGAGGERIKQVVQRLYSRMSAKIQPVSLRKLGQRISQFVERAGISLRPFPWGYCAAEGVKSPKPQPCSFGATHPNPSNGSPTICNACNLNIRTQSAVPFIENTIRLHAQIVADKHTPDLLRAASEKQICELQFILGNTANTAL